MKRVLLFAVVALAVSACGSNRDNAQGLELGPAFLTPVAAAEEAGLQVYWVGERFEVDGLLFRAVAADLEEQHAPPPLQIFYEADFEGEGSVAFTLASSHGATYEEAIDRQLSKPGLTTRHDTTVCGWRATLFERAVGRWTNRVVIVDAPDSLVLAIANATIGKGGQQVNPLNDPDRLLAVLEDLRPYPE